MRSRPAPPSPAPPHHCELRHHTTALLESELRYVHSQQKQAPASPHRRELRHLQAEDAAVVVGGEPQVAGHDGLLNGGDGAVVVRLQQCLERNLFSKKGSSCTGWPELCCVQPRAQYLLLRVDELLPTAAPTCTTSSVDSGVLLIA